MTTLTMNSLRNRMLNAGIWTAGGFMIQKLFQLVSNLVLTRILFPEAFGVMALANTVLIGLQMFSDVGIKPAIIQNRRGEEPDFLNTAWTIQVYRGFLLWAGACAFAYPASLIYKNELLFPLISVLGSTAAISGFSSISLALMERRLQTKSLTVVLLAGQLITLCITAFFAWALHSVWSLAYGGVAGAIVSTILSHILLPYHKHHFRWEPEAVRHLVRFGRWIFFATAITFIGGQGLRALQGLYIPPATLGIITIAQTLAWIPGDLTAQLMNLVGFPALSEIHQNSPDSLRATLDDMRKKALLGALPMFIGLGLVSLPVIELMYDDRYLAAAHYLAILTATGAISVVPLGYQSAILAFGNTRLHFAVLTITMISRVIFMIVGYELGQIDGMLIGIGVGSIVGYIYVACHAYKMKIFTLGPDAAAFFTIACGSLAIWRLYA